jgi:hypothetical protein
MSRNLPARPNLDYLKKEAKDRLDDLRRTDPSAQLADAQFALAREYGFASWPTMKAHVEAAAAADDSPFTGRWIADVARSKRHPANQFRSATIVFAVRGNSVEVNNEVLDEAGKVVRGRHTFQADGVEYPFTNGHALTATWRGVRMLETVATQHGKVVGRGIYTVSDDGRTLTITDENQEIVLDRV